MNANKKILIAVDAPGPADSVAPVVPLLQKQAEIKIVTVGPTPFARLQNFSPAPAETEEAARQIMDEFKPDLFFATTSSLVFGPFVVPALTKHAARLGTPVICLQDYWANHRHPMNSLVLKYWPIMLVQDEIGKKFLLDDHYRGKIIVTGNPALDALSEIDVPAERSKIRQALGLKDDDFLIVYIGRGTPLSAPEDEITFAFLASALRAMQDPPVLMVRPHPRDEAPERYEHLSEGLRIIKGDAIPDVHSALCAADLVAGMDSTSHIHAIYLRIPVMCLVLPHAGRARLTKMGLADFPPNLSGASIGIYEPDKNHCARIMERVRDDEGFRSQIRAKQIHNFPHPLPPAAQRVAREILRLLNK
jgi:hypothetical protein